MSHLSSNPLYSLALFAIGLLVGLFFRWRNSLKLNGFVLDRNRLIDRLNERLESLRDKTRQIGRDADEFQAAAQIFERKATSYREIIESIQTERDVWKNLYYEQASGHDAAQVMMLRESENLARAYQQATGKAPPRSAAIQAVRAEFEGRHGAAVAEYRKDGGAERSEETRAAEAKQIEAIDELKPSG